MNVVEVSCGAKGCGYSPFPMERGYCRDYVYASRASMYEHMRRTHGMPSLAAVREAA